MKDIGQSTAVRGTRGLVFEECRIEAVPTTVLQVAGYEGCDSEVFIPSEAFGLPVAMIAEGAFAFCDKIKKVTIDNGIGYIGRMLRRAIKGGAGRLRPKNGGILC